MSGPGGNIPILGGQVVLAKNLGTAIEQATGVFQSPVDGMMDLFRPMTIGVGTTAITTADDPKGAGRAIQTIKEVRTSGVFQPGDPQKLKVTRAGSRKWKNGVLYALPNFDVEVDSVIKVEGIVYRVTGKRDWNAAGYIRYDLLETPLANAR